MAKFKRTDIVVLKSGGPLMTIVGIQEPTDEGLVMVNCQWFAGDLRQDANFSEDIVALVSG